MVEDFFFNTCFELRKDYTALASVHLKGKKYTVVVRERAQNRSRINERSEGWYCRLIEQDDIGL